MTPRETLLAAAERLEKLVAAATSAPWFAVGNSVAYATHECTCSAWSPYGHEPGCGLEQLASTTTADAELIATMNPLVAAGLAELFRETADFIPFAKVVALAQLVLGGE